MSVFVSGGKLAFFVVVAGKFYYDRKKKIQSSVWRVRDHYYDRKKKDTVVCLVGARSLLRSEKKIQSSVWRVVLFCQFLVLAGNRHFFGCGGKVLLRPETKKDSVVCLAGE